MMIDATKLEPGNTYIIQTHVRDQYELNKTMEELRELMPEGVKCILLGPGQTLRSEK